VSGRGEPRKENGAKICPSTGLIHKIFLKLFMLIINDDPVKKNGANFEHVKRVAD
jgi:hypothetical protein